MVRLDTLGTISLRDADGQELRSVLTQPKRLALLCYLAVESPHGFHRRDRLFGLFWPEFGQAQARQALRQSLYFLRHAIGEHLVVNRGAEEIGIAPEALRCDVSTFIDLLDQNRLEDALALYHGDFLSGFFVADSSAEFEHWLYATREELRRRAVDAAWKLAEVDALRGAGSDAARWARYATRLDPDDEQSLRRLVRLLDSRGDRAAALRAYTEFAERLATEFGSEPSAETRALIDAVRSRTASPAATPEAPPAPPAPSVVAERAESELPARETVASPPLPLPLPPRRNRAVRAAYIGATLFAVTIIAVVLSRQGRSANPPPVIAVGWIQDPSGADTGAGVRTLAELLATDLARVPGLQVVSHARLYDMLGQLGIDQETPSAISEAARRAGAGAVLEAVLSTAPDRSMRLDLRRVDLASGSTGQTHTFTGSTLFELADRATAQTAAEFDLRAPAQPLTNVTTTSLAAQRLYEQGLRSFYQSDVHSADQLFHAALEEDSTFAMAAYYAGLSEQANDGTASRRDLALALRLADHVSDRERLTIRQAWAFLTNDPAQLAIAESLATRYPGEPGSELSLGRALLWHGDYLGAVPHLRAAIRMDSLSLSGRSHWCRACDALDLMIAAYINADSMQAAVRVATRWTRLQPRTPRAWWTLASLFDREELYDNARVAERTAERLSADGSSSAVPIAVRAIRAGQFAEADRLLQDQTQNGNPTERGDALWWLVISLRNQGRLRDALATAEQLVRNGSAEQPSFSTPTSLNAVAVAQVQFEMGHFRRAAALFDSIGDYDWNFSPDFRREAPGLYARHRIWFSMHVATSLAAAGDTARLAPIADSIAVWKRLSAMARDQVLDHYVRGLLLEARGQLPAAEQEFRRALDAPIDGYSRVNLQLARVLVAEGRAADAIPVLRAPLHGPIEASNYYLTGTDLHAALGDAFDRAGEPDSALAHYRYVLAAWHRADPEFRPRIDAIERRVRSLDQGIGRAAAGARTH